MNAYNTNHHQLQTRDSHNVERSANLQAAPPQPRAASGSNSSRNSSTRPARGTTFHQEPANAGYESYYSSCHPVYVDRPESFSSGQELEPDMYEPVVEQVKPIPTHVDLDMSQFTPPVVD